jgi:hypothetical protein
MRVRKVASMIIMIAMLVGLFGITGYAQEGKQQIQNTQDEKQLENEIQEKQNENQVQENQILQQTDEQTELPSKEDKNEINIEIDKPIDKEEHNNYKEQEQNKVVDKENNQVLENEESQIQKELESSSRTLSTINIINESIPVDIINGECIYYKGEKAKITIEATYVRLKKSAYKINNGSWCNFNNYINIEITEDAEITAKVFGKFFKYIDYISYRFVEAPAPTNLTLNTTSDSVDVSYDPVDRATGYKITVSKKGKVVKTKEVNSTTAVIDGLLPNEKYVVEVVTLIGGKEGKQTKKSCKTKEMKGYQLNITKNISEGGVYDILTQPNSVNGYTEGTIVDIRAYSNKGYSVKGFDVSDKDEKEISSLDDYIIKVKMDCDKNVVVNYKPEEKVYKMVYYAYNGSFSEQKEDVLGGSIDVDNNQYNAKPGDTIYLNFTLKCDGEGYGDATYNENNKLYDKLNEVFIGLRNTNKLLSSDPIYGIGYEIEDVIRVENLPITIPEDASGTYIYHFDMVDVYNGELAHIANSVDVKINIKVPVQNKTIKIIKKIKDYEDENENESAGAGFGFGLLPDNDESEDLIEKIYIDYDATLLDKLLRRGITDENGILQFDNIPIGNYIIFELPNPLMEYSSQIDRKRHITDKYFVSGEDITIEWINISHNKLDNAIVNFKVQGRGIIRNEGIAVDKYIGDSNGPTNYYYYNPQLISLFGEASNGWSFDHWLIEEVDEKEENRQKSNGSFFDGILNVTRSNNNLKNKQLEFNVDNPIKYNITAVFKENYIPPTPVPNPDPYPTYYKLTLECTEGGKILPSPGERTYAWNTHVIMQIKPEEGYIFTGWEGDTDLLLTENKIVVKRTAKLKAVFEEKKTQPEEEYKPEPDPEPEPEPEVQPEQNPEICIEINPQTEEEIEILDEQVPAGAPQQSPKTGGFPGVVLYGLGSLLMTSGLVLECKRKKYK